MSPGRNSRLSQILRNVDGIRKGEEYSQESQNPDIHSLSIAGIASLTNDLLKNHQGISEAQRHIDENLNQKMSLNNDPLKSKIEVGSSDYGQEQQLRLMLEKLNLDIARAADCSGGKLGLGTDNLLYMACELLLLQQIKEGNRLLLIEEPEAHLHVQRQLKIMKSLQKEAQEKNVQVIVTTHSPLLSSVIDLENLVLIQKGKAFPLSSGETELSPSDYRFLARFLDATKANLFFAKEVVIVEGDAENILLPTIARLIGRDFTDYGVSVVNVGGTGLRRYAKIFQRKVVDDDELDIPVACITDLDVMPDCAPCICLDKSDDITKWPKKADRRWRAVADFSGGKLEQRRQEIKAKSDGQRVNTFVADHWTFEYDLAFSGLGKEVYCAAKMAIKDERNVPKAGSFADVLKDAKNTYRSEISEHSPTYSSEEAASNVYALFTKGTKASKAIAAQYLGCILEHYYREHPEELIKKLPPYLKKAIEYVTEPVGSSNEPS